MHNCAVFLFLSNRERRQSRAKEKWSRWHLDNTILYSIKSETLRIDRRREIEKATYKVSVSTRIVILKSVLLRCGGTIIKYLLDLMLIKLRYYSLKKFSKEMVIVYLRGLKRVFKRATNRYVTPDLASNCKMLRIFKPFATKSFLKFRKIDLSGILPLLFYFSLVQTIPFKRI